MKQVVSLLNCVCEKFEWDGVCFAWCYFVAEFFPVRDLSSGVSLVFIFVVPSIKFEDVNTHLLCVFSLTLIDCDYHAMRFTLFWFHIGFTVYYGAKYKRLFIFLFSEIAGLLEWLSIMPSFADFWKTFQKAWIIQNFAMLFKLFKWKNYPEILHFFCFVSFLRHSKSWFTSFFLWFEIFMLAPSSNQICFLWKLLMYPAQHVIVPLKLLYIM